MKWHGIWMPFFGKVNVLYAHFLYAERRAEQKNMQMDKLKWTAKWNKLNNSIRNCYVFERIFFFIHRAAFFPLLQRFVFIWKIFILLLLTAVYCCCDFFSFRLHLSVSLFCPFSEFEYMAGTQTVFSYFPIQIFGFFFAVACRSLCVFWHMRGKKVRQQQCSAKMNESMLRRRRLWKFYFLDCFAKTNNIRLNILRTHSGKMRSTNSRTYRKNLI